MPNLISISAKYGHGSPINPGPPPRKAIILDSNVRVLSENVPYFATTTRSLHSPLFRWTNPRDSYEGLYCVCYDRRDVCRYLYESLFSIFLIGLGPSLFVYTHERRSLRS